MGARFTYRDDGLHANLSGISRKINARVAVITDRNAAWGEAYAKSSAPWSDDTGAARVGLFAFPSSSGGHHEILVSHSVSYGIWLEIAHSGKYQIILPTVRATGEHFMADLRGMLSRL